MKKEEEKNSNKLKKKVMYILSGSVLTEDFFVKNTLFIGVILILMVVYISNRYSYIEQMSKIESLQRELKASKYEYQTVSSDLMGVSRQSQVTKRIEDDQIGLEISTKPTYEINSQEESDNKITTDKANEKKENDSNGE